MDAGFVEWVQWISTFIYNFMYTVKVPGVGIPFIYFFILCSLFAVTVQIVRRILIQPTGGSKNAKKEK